MRIASIMLGLLLLSGCQPTIPREYVPLTIGMPEIDLRLACDAMSQGDISIERNGARWYWIDCYRNYRRYASAKVINSVVDYIIINTN